MSWWYDEYDDWFVIIVCVLSFLVFREEEMQLLNRSTNTKMATFSILSLGVCLSVAALQLWHLKTFFERKKLLWFFSHSLLLIYSFLTNCLLVLFFSFLKIQNLIIIIIWLLDERVYVGLNLQGSWEPLLKFKWKFSIRDIFKLSFCRPKVTPFRTSTFLIFLHYHTMPCSCLKITFF